MVSYKKIVQQDGRVSGTARKQIERKTGRSIVSKKNFLPNKKQKDNNKSLPTT
ncbi:MAG: hypothetical protein ABIJ23_04865 [Candidatus Magasanikbacteria bacterium]